MKYKLLTAPPGADTGQGPSRSAHSHYLPKWSCLYITRDNTKLSLVLCTVSLVASTKYRNVPQQPAAAPCMPCLYSQIQPVQARSESLHCHDRSCRLAFRCSNSQFIFLFAIIGSRRTRLPAKHHDKKGTLTLVEKRAGIRQDFTEEYIPNQQPPREGPAFARTSQGSTTTPSCAGWPQTAHPLRARGPRAAAAPARSRSPSQTRTGSAYSVQGRRKLFGEALQQLHQHPFRRGKSGYLSQSHRHPFQQRQTRLKGHIIRAVLNTP